MDFITPLIVVLSSLGDNLFRKVITSKNLDQSIEYLENALQELIEMRDDLKKQVDQAELVGLTCTYQVKGWLARVDKVEAEVRLIREGMEQMTQCLFGCNANCRLRYEFRQKIAKKLVLVNDLKGKGNLEVDLADGLLLVPVVEIPSRPAVGLELMSEKVRQLLREDNIGTIGIYGMGGVGKTTLLKCLNNGFLTLDHDFDVVIWAFVSKDFLIEKIQQAIGVRLGLSWDEIQFQELRAARIHSVMRKKKFLLLLDDVWEGFNLENIGIPIPSKENGCKVVFTTRSIEVCTYMYADYKLKVEFLNEKESWELFHQNGDGSEIVNSPLISVLAKTIIKKCGGLPLALITMRMAMANKRTEAEWSYAVEVLHKTPTVFRGMEDVFSLLKFSYDNLDNDTFRSCVLYCSLFPEDYSIEKEQLIEYWAGEGFLDSVQNGNLHGHAIIVQNGNLHGHAIIGSLKVACFLETGEEESQVKMHDVVLSFALWMVSEHGNTEKKFVMQASEGLIEAPCAERWERAERISLLDNEITKLTMTAACPNLSTLLLQWNNGLSNISDEFFQNMPVLKVLDLSFTSIKELPRSICDLVEIRHLDLSGTKLKTLPRELGSLSNLRHLNMQRNQYLTKIPLEAILGLHNLRTLNFYYSFSSWEMQDLEGSIELRFKDLELLRNLDSLGITVTDLSTLQRVSRSETLRICIEYLYIKECRGLCNLPLSSHPGDGDGDRLRRLSINNCWELKYLSIGEAAGLNWLPNLEILALNGLPNLTSIWNNKVSYGCLQNLRCVNIWYCLKLKNISWILRLPKLEMIYIFYCKKMEEVISGEDVNEEDYSNAFPKLRIISIRDAPELRNICQKATFFPCLKKIAVIDCPKLRKLPLKAHNVSELPTVYCNKEWWDNLIWDDTDTKNTLLPYFMASDGDHGATRVKHRLLTSIWYKVHSIRIGLCLVSIQ